MKMNIPIFESTSMPQLVEIEKLGDFAELIKKLEDTDLNKVFLEQLKEQKAETFMLPGNIKIKHIRLRDHEGIMYHVRNEVIDYYVRYAKSPLLLGTPFAAIKQAKVWRSEFAPSSEKVVSPIMFDHLLPRLGRLATDEIQTVHGKRMWIRTIHTAFEKGYYVYHVYKGEQATQIHDPDELERLKNVIWGKGQAYMDHLILISTNPVQL